MKKNLISVIVPIYNVQDFLDECLESIVNQTLSNLEIILVDDGSQDKCPVICDEWADRDSRIKVLHKKNGGLSSARNAGLDVASGEFVCFVDSDDFLCKNALQSLYNRIVKDANVGIVSGMIYRYRDGNRSDFRSNWKIGEERIMMPENFLLNVVKQETSYTVYNKLYRRNIITNVRFQEGRNNEDALFMYDLGKSILGKSIYIVDIPEYVYYYRYRENSICTNSTVPLAIDTLANYEFMMKDCKATNAWLFDVLYAKYIDKLCEFLDALLQNPVWHPLYFSKYQKKLRKIPFKVIIKYNHTKRVFLVLLLKWLPVFVKMYRKTTKHK